MKGFKRVVDGAGTVLAELSAWFAVAFLLLPVGVTLLMSFDGRNFLGAFPPTTFSLRWYRALLANPNYMRGFQTSAELAILAAGGATVAGVCAALVLHRSHFRGKEVLTALLLAPLVVPGVVIGFALVMTLGFINIESAFLRLLLGHLLISVPYAVRTTLASLTGIRSSLGEAAASLGANELQVFWDVTFPLARTGIFAGAVFALAFSFDDVPMSIFLSGPDAFTFPVVLLGSMRSSFNLSIAAGAMLLVAFTVGLIVVLDRLVGIERVVGEGIYRS